MYYAHAGHQHLEEQAAKSHDISSTFLIVGTTLLVIATVVGYVLLTKHRNKKADAKSGK